MNFAIFKKIYEIFIILIVQERGFRYIHYT